MAKVMVSLPDQLLARLDAEAARTGTSRSALLAMAGEQQLGTGDAAAVAAAVARSRERFARAGLRGTAEQIVRLDRDERSLRDRRRSLRLG